MEGVGTDYAVESLTTRDDLCNLRMDNSMNFPETKLEILIQQSLLCN